MKKNIKITLAVLAAGVILSTAVRYFVIVEHTDMKTGFIYHGDEVLWNVLYYGIIALISIAAIFTGKIGGCELPDPAGICKNKTIAAGVLAMFAGGFSAYEGISEINAITPMKFLIIIDLVYAAVLVVIGFVTVRKRKFTPGLGYTYSIIGAYCVCRGIYCFMSRMAVVTVPEYVIEVVSLITMAICFVLLGKYLSGNAAKNTGSALCFWGVSSAVLILSSSFGGLIAKFAAPEDISRRIVFTSYDAESFRQASQGVEPYNMVLTPPVNIVMGILAAVAVMIAVGSSAKEEQSDE